MDTARAYELMESGALVNIKFGSPSPPYPDWLSPNPDDSDLVRLTKQVILCRPNLRLLRKVSMENRDRVWEERVDFCRCELNIIRRFEKRSYLFGAREEEKDLSPFQTHLSTLNGFFPELIDCPKDRISFLQDYFLVPFVGVSRCEKIPSALDMPLHLFESNEELIGLAVRSINAPLTPKFEAILDMCQYLLDYSIRFDE